MNAPGLRILIKKINTDCADQTDFHELIVIVVKNP